MVSDVRNIPVKQRWSDDISGEIDRLDGDVRGVEDDHVMVDREFVRRVTAADSRTVDRHALDRTVRRR